jgi:hypothetical protein
MGISISVRRAAAVPKVADDQRRLPANRNSEATVVHDPDRMFHGAHLGLPCNG